MYYGIVAKIKADAELALRLEKASGSLTVTALAWVLGSYTVGLREKRYRAIYLDVADWGWWIASHFGRIGWGKKRHLELFKFPE